MSYLMVKISYNFPIDSMDIIPHSVTLCCELFHTLPQLSIFKGGKGESGDTPTPLRGRRP